MLLLAADEVWYWDVSYLITVLGLVDPGLDEAFLDLVIRLIFRLGASVVLELLLLFWLPSAPTEGTLSPRVAPPRHFDEEIF